MGMAGDSGGAHLNLAATLYLRQEVGDASYIKALLLYYGCYGLTDSASRRLLGGAWDGLTEEDWKFYIGNYAEDPVAILKDDSATLAAICEQYGTPCKYEVFEGTIHAFLHYTRVLDDANDALEHGASFFREVCGMGLRGIN